MMARPSTAMKGRADNPILWAVIAGLLIDILLIDIEIGKRARARAPF